MCGIFGAIGQDLPASAITTVLNVTDHRGPDGRGVFVDEQAKITLAHNRLSVIDPATGAQPLESDDGSIVLIANGEIYDFERIRSSLEAKGYHFKTKSDSEVIIYLYKEHGLAFLEQLRGEFAFLLYDRARSLFIAARDRFGIKPLYFSRLDKGFVFASEVKAIFASGLVAPKLNVAAFDLLVDHDPVNALFPFEGIEHLPPATYMAVDLESGEARIQSYWSAEIPDVSAQPVAEPLGDAPAAAARLVLKELEEAVRLRLRADVPVGLYLSGGLDSCVVGALMQRNLDSNLHSFSISFVGSGRNEQEFTRRAAEFLGTTHHDLVVTKQMLWDNLEDCVWHTELPFVSLAPVGLFLLSGAAKKFVTVVLNGQGADEVFLGYRSFFQKAIRDTRTEESSGKPTPVRLRRLKMAPGGVAGRWSLLVFDKRHRERLAQLRTKAAGATAPERPIVNLVQEARIADMPFDILGFLGDRVEMAHSLEVRVPFLDHKLYDAAKWIPDDLKMRDGVEKAVLRDAAAGLLPDDLRLRRKLGFMLTSDSIDFFGTDRKATEQMRATYLSREAFDRLGVFSYRAYLALSVFARVPGAKRFRRLKLMRRNSNKLIMYMMQTHMLQKMYVDEPRWAEREAGRLKTPAAPAAYELAG
jgi:asparagine synthase (glutamine-hydrolysing)